MSEGVHCQHKLTIFTIHSTMVYEIIILSSFKSLLILFFHYLQKENPAKKIVCSTNWTFVSFVYILFLCAFEYIHIFGDMSLYAVYFYCSDIYWALAVLALFFFGFSPDPIVVSTCRVLVCRNYCTLEFVEVYSICLYDVLSDKLHCCMISSFSCSQKDHLCIQKWHLWKLSPNILYICNWF